MRPAAYLDRLGLLGERTVLAHGVWRVPLLRGGDSMLVVGAPADFLLLRPDSCETGLGDLASDLVYAATGSVVDTTVVAGRVLMRGGEVEGASEVLAQAAERARGLGLG